MSDPNPELLVRLRALLENRLITDADRRRRYEIPERGEPGHTPAVLVPQSEEEVAAILKLCNQFDGRLVISAGRTGLVEAQRPQGELVLSLERLSAPLVFELADGRRYTFDTAQKADAQIDGLARWWRDLGAPSLSGARLSVQAGISVDNVNALLEPLGLMWPMEMGSTSAATAGACVANASAGANAVCYGTAAQLCESAWGLWGDGSSAGPCRAPVWQPIPADTLAVDSSRVHPDWGLIGSQGLFGIITHLRLRTYAIPAQREGVLLPVADMPTAMQVLTAAREAFPGSVEEFEFIGRAALQLVQLHLGESLRLPFERDPQSPYYLLLQVKSHDADEDLASRLYGFLADALQWPEALIGYAPLPSLKKLRHSITESSNARMRALGGGRLSFDTATPVAVFGDYLAELDGELRRAAPAVEFVAFGHAGVGGAHLHLLGTREAPVAERATELIALVFDVTQRFGGTFSAEHGIGPKWGAEFQRRMPATARDALLQAKRRHDPRGVLSPRSFGLDRT
jgi:FAD/FMN-containing dehydrogenase